MQKDKDGIPIFITLNFEIFATWLKNIREEKWMFLSDEDKLSLCRQEWQKLYRMAGDYNIE